MRSCETNVASNEQKRWKGKAISKSNGSEKEPRRFKWDIDMVGYMLQALSDYKSQMEYRNSDFNADKAKQYEAVRTSMAEKYQDVEVSFFGPTDVNPVDESNREESLKRIEVQKKQIRKGYSRVMEKIKELRQGFSNAVTAGTRSGSGKLVMEFYDTMVEIWGGSPATEPLPFCVQSSQQTSDGVTLTNSLDKFEDNSVDENVHAPVSASFTISDEELDFDNEVATSKDDVLTSRKRGNANQIPKLIDDKRKKMERQLSAVQRDKLFLQDEKEEKEFRRELCKSIKESNSVFAESLKAMSSSMTVLASSLQRSVEFSTMTPRQTTDQTPVSFAQALPTVFQHGNYIENQDMRYLPGQQPQHLFSAHQQNKTYHQL